MKNPTILVVEDDVWLAEQEKRVLEKAGYAVTISPYPIAAIKEIDASRPDVIILDMLLTGSTAFALLHELQSYGDTSDIPVILCTNLASELSLENLKSYGVRRILDKTTMLPDDVVVAVRSVLV